jgi:hypothetical protein
VAPDPIVAVTIPPADWNETEFCRAVRQTFDAFVGALPLHRLRQRERLLRATAGELERDQVALRRKRVGRNRQRPLEALRGEVVVLAGDMHVGQQQVRLG